MRSRNNSFNGYKKQLKPQVKMETPKTYKINGLYIIGEYEAELFKRYGYKVEEVKWQD